MNKFGGNWTEAKIEILIEYGKAYLAIMNIYAKKFNWKLMYFDGFAGSGFIKRGKEENERIIIGAAKRMLELNNPRAFDEYYFVEKEENNFLELSSLKTEYPEKKIYIVQDDCNERIQRMGNFLESNRGKQYRVLSYIDPCGMQLNWDSLVALKKAKVDAWILVPTGMGVNRLLKKNGKISDAWIDRLQVFLGMEKDEIKSYFYKESTVLTLFGEETVINKEEKAVEKSAELYQSRLKDLFDYVSDPYILRNKSKSIMFHFYMVTNNKNAVKIANEIILKYNKTT